MNREDFPMLKQGYYYLDSAATSLKPKSVIDAVVDYYKNYTSNAHRGDYDLSYKVSEVYDGVRESVRLFINAKRIEEIIFTSGTTMSLNMIIEGFFKNKLKAGDEVLITKAEHSSLVLPWLTLIESIGIKVKYMELNENYELTFDNFKESVTEKTKVVSIAHITNVIGDVRPVKEITSYAHQLGIYVVLDGAQSVPHLKTDVQDLDVDFLAFSGHKMLGPTGIGILYGKYELLNELKPTIVGGGMNIYFNGLNEYEYKELPDRLEAGTQNIEGIIGLGASIDYLNKIGMDNITKHDQELKAYAISKLKEINNIELYNANSTSGIVTFNIKGIFSQDTALYLNKHKVCVRAGSHCAKSLKECLNISNTCRISFYLYNTKEEIDYVVALLKNDNILEGSL